MFKITDTVIFICKILLITGVFQYRFFKIKQLQTVELQNRSEINEKSPPVYLHIYK